MVEKQLEHKLAETGPTPQDALYKLTRALPFGADGKKYASLSIDPPVAIGHGMHAVSAAYTLLEGVTPQATKRGTGSAPSPLELAANERYEKL